ncbi:hypothetical protein F2P81_025013 [Scophthalmus maximus]|uniref:Ig-like domain-containing protein n=1 Tax=Scophthalmus maximus TaxID=52904 RepID=A0A6A4RVD8_SCOMX|nr:hypothetical protein F2P81_025013 [Scophthalmus maximus]
MLLLRRRRRRRWSQLGHEQQKYKYKYLTIVLEQMLCMSKLQKCIKEQLVRQFESITPLTKSGPLIYCHKNKEVSSRQTKLILHPPCAADTELKLLRPLIWDRFSAIRMKPAVRRVESTFSVDGRNGVESTPPSIVPSFRRHDFKLMFYSSTKDMLIDTWPCPTRFLAGDISYQSSAGAKVNVTMPETVEVYLGDTAQILLQYRFDHNESNDFLIQWIVRNEDNSRRRIWYYDNLRGHNVADRNTAYTDRIEMTKDQQSFLLTIEDVQLSDEREFYCQVNGLEARTSLRVFAPPEAPVIEGVTAAISVTNDLPSEVATCVTKNGYPRPKFTWYRNNVPLMADRDDLDMLTLSWESQGLYTVQSTLQYKVTKEDKDAEFSCEVSFLVPGTIRRVKSSSVNVTVHWTLWSDRARHSLGCQRCGHGLGK